MATQYERNGESSKEVDECHCERSERDQDAREVHARHQILAATMLREAENTPNATSCQGSSATNVARA